MTLCKEYVFLANGTTRSKTHLEQHDARLTHALRHGSTAMHLFLAHTLNSTSDNTHTLPFALPRRATPQARHSIHSLRICPRNPMPQPWTTHKVPPMRTGARIRHTDRDPPRVHLSRNYFPPAQGRVSNACRSFVSIPNVPLHVEGLFFFLFPGLSTPPPFSLCLNNWSTARLSTPTPLWARRPSMPC